MKNVYYLVNRGWGWIFHLVCYQLGSLRFLPDSEQIHLYVPYLNKDFSVEDVEFLNRLQPNLGLEEYNYRSSVKDDVSMYLEIVNLLPKKFNIITSYREIPKDHSIVFWKTPPNIEKPGHYNTIPSETYVYLRNLLNCDDDFNVPSRKIYISRNNSHLHTVNTAKTRHIINERELYNELISLGFEYIQLENYSIKDKIKLFKESNTIISPNGGALTFLLFSKPKTKVIELIPDVIGHVQFKELSESLGLDYFRFNKTKSYDEYYNMVLDIDPLIEMLK